MRALKYIIFLLLIAVIGLSIYVAVQPNTFEVTQSRNIKAPSAVIYETVLDTSATDHSSFWKDTEQLKTVTASPTTSLSQTYTSHQIGNSELTWIFKPNGDGTTLVTRKLIAKDLSFLYKAKSILSNKIVNNLQEQMETSLEKLDNEVIESMATYSITVNGITEYGGGFYMYKTTSSSAANISNIMARQYAEIMNFMQENAIPQAGMPFTIYLQMNDNGSVIMSNAIPVRDRVVVADDSNVLCGYIEKTKAVKATLKGDYSNLAEAWKKAMTYLKANNIEPSEQPPFEIYLNDPGSVPNPANYLTEIYIPVKENPVETEAL